MKPFVFGLIMLGLMLICMVIVCIYNCRKLKEDWYEKQPPRFRDYFWKTIETILEFFD